MCLSHLQELCGRQVYVGINDLKAGTQILGAQLWNRTSDVTLHQIGENAQTNGCRQRQTKKKGSQSGLHTE